MSEAVIPAPQPKPFDFKRLFTFLLRPRQVFEQMAAAGKPTWLLPMLLLSLGVLLRVVVTGYLRGHAMALGELNLPSDFQFWSPDMQNKYMQGIQATQGHAFRYYIPAVTGLTGLWLGWPIISSLLHLLSTLLGGRGSQSASLNVVAWANLPFFLRDVLRVVYMAIAGHEIASPGLSGFIVNAQGGAVFLANLLKHTDLFFIWYLLLLAAGMIIFDNLTRGKAWLTVGAVLLLSLLAQAGAATLFASMNGTIVSQPFMF